MASERKRFILGVVVAVGILALATAGCFIYRHVHAQEQLSAESEIKEAECLARDAIKGEIEEAPTEEVEETASKLEKTEFINLQPVVDNWVKTSQYGEAAVEIYDLDYNRVAASYRANASMYPRSIYKLFYVYDGYAQIDAGKENASQNYLDGLSIGECLDIMVRQSNNPCAEAMLEDSARLTRVDDLIKNLGLANTQSDGLKSSAHDISLLLQHYYRHPD